MDQVKSFFARPRNAVLVVALVAGVAAGAAYAASGRSERAGRAAQGTVRLTTPTKPVAVRAKQAAVANVLAADVKIGRFYGDFYTYTGISAEQLVKYGAAFDPSQFTVVATHGGHDFYVCSRKGKWYAEQVGVHRSPVATKTPGPLCRL